LGVPVISSNSGGLSEVNFEGISGYLSDVGNTDEMAENALKILRIVLLFQNLKKCVICS
jgi:glycosyltransferase involved in cell wall biosynthesis